MDGGGQWFGREPRPGFVYNIRYPVGKRLGRITQRSQPAAYFQQKLGAWDSYAGTDHAALVRRWNEPAMTNSGTCLGIYSTSQSAEGTRAPGAPGARCRGTGRPARYRAVSKSLIPQILVGFCKWMIL